MTNSFKDLSAIYDDVWQQRPFTNVPMIQEAVNQSDMSMIEICKLSDEKWKEILLENLLEKFDQTDEIFEHLKRESHGTCTSFALAVIEAIPLQNFTIGDTGGHRDAWTKDGILIDSSVRRLFSL